MGDFFFNDIWRMDWGLGNPNKTAVLIAELMLVVWAFAFIRKYGYWIALVLFTGLGVCLFHTFSRGGLVALLVGLVWLAIFAPHPWPKRKWIAGRIVVLILCSTAVYLKSYQRYTQGFITEDRSITNRIAIWSTVPAMMFDAPYGWGIGNAGTAFMGWYQDIHRGEEYRTLVNSHLTWLVEMGWIGRFFYLFGWGAVLLLCFPSFERYWQSIPFGIWWCFGTGAFFSSVAESIWLWPIPVAAFAVTLFDRIRRKQFPRLSDWLLVCGGTILLLLAAAVSGGSGSGIHVEKGRVIVGRTTPETWLVIDEVVVGCYGYGRALRDYYATANTHSSIGLTHRLAELPENLSGITLVIAGQPADFSPTTLQKVSAQASRTILLAPRYSPTGLENIPKDKISIIFGGLSVSPERLEWSKHYNIKLISGTADYFPDWPQLILEKENE